MMNSNPSDSRGHLSPPIDDEIAKHDFEYFEDIEDLISTSIDDEDVERDLGGLDGLLNRSSNNDHIEQNVDGLLTKSDDNGHAEQDRGDILSKSSDDAHLEQDFEG